MRFKKPKFWDSQSISILQILLFPLSIVYLFIIRITRIPFLFKDYKKQCPIICIGNIYLGGTGKTPLAIEIFKSLKSFGKKPVFIKKNYDYLTDEIKMLSETGETYFDKNRISAIDHSIKKGNDIAILDDGFQDFTIKPDFSILCFNSKQLIGNGFLIPSGPLREPLSAVNRADCIVINGDRTKETLDFQEKLKKSFGKKKLHFFYSKYRIKNLEKFKEGEIIAFAGIGNPSNFFDLLKENDFKIKETYSFPDHHFYTQDDFKKITKDKFSKIVTTKKDYFRLNNDQKKICDFVEVSLEIQNRDQLENLIKGYL